MNAAKALRLRTKLVLARLLVEAVMLALLVANSLRLTGESLIEQTRLKVEGLNVLFNAALAAPLSSATMPRCTRSSRMSADSREFPT